MHGDMMKRGLVMLGIVAGSFGIVAVPAGAGSGPDGVRPAELACTPELPVAGKVCTPV